MGMISMLITMPMSMMIVLVKSALKIPITMTEIKTTEMKMIAMTIDYNDGDSDVYDIGYDDGDSDGYGDGDSDGDSDGYDDENDGNYRD